MARRQSGTRPKSLVEFIIEAIDEVAPGRGREVYMTGFEHYSVDAAERAHGPHGCAS